MTNFSKHHRKKFSSITNSFFIIVWHFIRHYDWFHRWRQFFQCDRTRVFEFLHRFIESRNQKKKYENFLICVLIVLSIHQNRWMNSNKYFFILFIVIKINRIMIIQHVCFVNDFFSFNEIDYVFNQNVNQFSFKKNFMLQIMKKMMNRFMIRDIFDFMQWMLNLRTYDFKIQFNIIFENHVDWIKNEIVYKQIQFNMSNFREIFHDFMTRNKRLLFEKLLFNVVEFNLDVEFFFKIFWSRFRNNFVDEQNEWNFFQNLRNDWNIDDFIKWLWKKIEKLEKHKNFVKNHNNQFQWQHNDISKYMKHVIDFREKLLIFMHFIDD